MFGSSIGNIFKITTWGESHGKAVGVVVDGCPAGLPLSEEDIQIFLNRRKPGQSPYATPRNEADEVEILSGIFDGKTTGTPISMLVWNTSARSSDYSEIAKYYRPGHADYTFEQKYGFRDYRGGGRSSARETIARVAAGAIASKFLNSLGINLQAYTRSIGPVSIDETAKDFSEIYKNPLNMPDKEAAVRAEALLKEMMAAKDSIGGTIDCEITGLPVGLGETVFEKLDANLAKAMMSIGAVKGVEIGDGFRAAFAYGSQNNDAFYMEDGHVAKKTNHSGGTLGGMSDGSPVHLRIAIKPTPSIFQSQETVNNAGENIEIQIKGRHDPVIVPRAVVVVESMAAITVMDALLANMTSRMDRILKFYKTLE